MKLKKFYKNKRAFSAIIAALIMMLLAVAAGVVVYAYVMGWIGGAQQNPTQTGKLSFDSITANATAGTISMYVRNVGSNNIILNQAYVGGTAVANATAITSTTGVLAVQSTAYLQVSYAMTVHNFYDVKVVCKDGTTVSTSVEAT
jgi:hypothetical protein